MKKTLPAVLAVAVAASFVPVPAAGQTVPDVGPSGCVAFCGGSSSSGGSSSRGSSGGSSVNLPSGFSSNSRLSKEFGSGEGIEGFADRSSASSDGEAEADLRELLKSVTEGSATAPALALSVVEAAANDLTQDLAERARESGKRRIKERARLMQQRDRYILEAARHEQAAIYWEMAKLSAETIKLGSDLFALMTLPYNPMVVAKAGVVLNARRGFQIAQRVGEVGDALFTGYQTYQSKKGEGQGYAVFAALGAGGLKLGVDVGAGELTAAVGKWALKATNASKNMRAVNAIVQNVSVGLIYMGVNAGATAAKTGTGAALAPKGST